MLMSLSDLSWLGMYQKQRQHKRIFMNLTNHLISLSSRPPDFIVGNPDKPYLLRWHLIPRNPFINIYLHCFKDSDQNREMHDHPWCALSVILKGMYGDHTENGFTILKAGDWQFRLNAFKAHRIELIDGECWSLFMTGPRFRNWGFICRNDIGQKRWVPWEKYCDARDRGQVGNGCD